jgi:hypothetical protein
VLGEDSIDGGPGKEAVEAVRLSTDVAESLLGQVGQELLYADRRDDPREVHVTVRSVADRGVVGGEAIGVAIRGGGEKLHGEQQARRLVVLVTLVLLALVQGQTSLPFERSHGVDGGSSENAVTQGAGGKGKSAAPRTP